MDARRPFGDLGGEPGEDQPVERDQGGTQLTGTTYPRAERLAPRGMIGVMGPGTVRARFVRLAATGFGLALVAAACTASDLELGRSVTTPTGSTTTSPDAEGPRGVDGADGIGDPYFPGLGNGGYDVAAYDLAIEWLPDTSSIDATATIFLTATEDLASFVLDLAGLEVERVVVDGTTARTGRDGHELRITPPTPLLAGTPVTVVVDYRGTPEPLRLGTVLFDLGWHVDGRDVYVVSEPGGAATWFPANDHPSDKARFRFAVTVPAGMEVIANGIERSSDTVAGRTTWIYESPDLMATYLASVVIGDLVFDRGTAPTGTRLRSAYPQRLADAAQTDFADVGAILAVFEDWFGPYPFSVYGHVVVDEDLGFALENQTLSLFGSDLITGEDRIDGVVAHEAAHQWFGNAVSVASWRDVWLNEGFATYAEWIWEQESGGKTITESAVAAHADADFGVAPGDPGPIELFQPTVYIRGGLVLHALAETIGDEAFRALLPAWVARHDDAAATTADLVVLAEELSGQDLDDFFDRWVYGAELPPLP